MILDLNADLGEGAGTDAALMPLVTSANISCGFHAGDADTIAAALVLANRYGVSIGAHPGYPDREHFGRREVVLDGWQVERMCLHQLGAFRALADHHSTAAGFVKPHGGFYHQTNRDESYATGLLNAVIAYGGDYLAVVGLPGLALQSVAVTWGIPFIAEGFADRRYRPDGSLVPRTEPDALLHDPKEVAEQVEWLVRTKGVRTVCVHGDTPGAVEFVGTVRGWLLDRGHELKAFCERPAVHYPA
jgi:5-oxoprolinase (ATP-hydrolysing) subunit A